jgi:hypothetical protein
MHFEIPLSCIVDCQSEKYRTATCVTNLMRIMEFKCLVQTECAP